MTFSEEFPKSFRVLPKTSIHFRRYSNPENLRCSDDKMDKLSFLARNMFFLLKTTNQSSIFSPQPCPEGSTDYRLLQCRAFEQATAVQWESGTCYIELIEVACCDCLGVENHRWLQKREISVSQSDTIMHSCNPVHPVWGIRPVFVMVSAPGCVLTQRQVSLTFSLRNVQILADNGWLATFGNRGPFLK